VWFWKIVEKPLLFGAHVFWQLSYRSMGVSLCFQRLDLKVYERIDPEGVKKRRREVLLMQQQNDEGKNAW
jgi:hypothetical protein